MTKTAPEGTQAVIRAIRLLKELSRQEGEVAVGDLLLHRTIAGPTRAGEVVEATIEVPADAIALVGRVVDADGRPVAGEQLWLRCNLPHERYTLHTDDHGRFLWHPESKS